MALRWSSEPLMKAWISQNVPPSLRATVFSLNGQVGAFGEMVGGLPIGALAQIFSLRATLAASGAILALALPLLGKDTLNWDAATAGALFAFVGITDIFAMGDGLVGPSIAGLLSRAADEKSQGQVQGGSQAVQSLARVIGPLGGGELYDQFGHGSLYVVGSLIALATIGFVSLTLPMLRPADKVESPVAVS